MVCSIEALIDRKEYELPLPPRLADKAAQDKAFRQWQADALIKYPHLLMSYDLLRGCWDHYTTKAKP